LSSLRYEPPTRLEPWDFDASERTEQDEKSELPSKVQSDLVLDQLTPVMRVAPGLSRHPPSQRPGEPRPIPQSFFAPYRASSSVRSGLDIRQAQLRHKTSNALYKCTLRIWN